MIRTRYQIIMEGILENEQFANTALYNFKERHSSGAFLCHYRNCPRAAQGFNTLELRQKHEESHAPRFQCADAACGFFGLTFNTRAALKRHAARYHDEENAASVPDSLTRKPRKSYKDSPLFTLTEVTPERKLEDQPQPQLPPGNALSAANLQSHQEALNKAGIHGRYSMIAPRGESEIGMVSSALDQLAPQQRATAQSEFNELPFNSDLNNTEILENFGIEPFTFETDVPPQSYTLSDILQVSKQGHLTGKSVSPAMHISEQPSPFSASSQFAGDQAAPLASAAQSREQEENEANYQNTRHRPLGYYNSYETILPKASLNEFENTRYNSLGYYNSYETIPPKASLIDFDEIPSYASQRLPIKSRPRSSIDRSKT